MSELNSRVGYHLVSMYSRMRYRDEGAGMVEYALLVALIGVVLVGALVLLQGGIESTFSEATEVLNDPEGAGDD